MTRPPPPVDPPPPPTPRQRMEAADLIGLCRVCLRVPIPGRHYCHRHTDEESA